MARTYEEIRELCQFGNQPVEGKTVVQPLGAGYGHNSYKVIDNGATLDPGEIALFCDSGNLPFGFTMQGGVIKVFTD